jgi:hypothetical protein
MTTADNGSPVALSPKFSNGSPAFRGDSAGTMCSQLHTAGLCRYRRTTHSSDAVGTTLTTIGP